MCSEIDITKPEGNKWEMHGNYCPARCYIAAVETIGMLIGATHFFMHQSPSPHFHHC